MDLKSQSLGKACSLEATFFLTRENFFPSFPFGQGVTGIELQIGQVEESHFSSSKTQKRAWKIMYSVLELAKGPVWGREVTDLAGWQTENSKGVEWLWVQRSC